MGIFSRKAKKTEGDAAVETARKTAADEAALATLVINTMTEGVVIVDSTAKIQMINPAAIALSGCGDAANAVNMSFSTIFKVENGTGVAIDDPSNVVLTAIFQKKPLEYRDYVLVNLQEQRRPVAITVAPASGLSGQCVVTIRDITKELAEEGEQAEFISTASHEMRTPVASIEGYLGLALNTQTATIDDRARKYLTEAHTASQHLGRLFKDLLDVTKLDDNKVKLHMVPIEVTETVRGIVDGQVPAMGNKKLRYTFGNADAPQMGANGGIDMDRNVYAMVDTDFLREVIDNLVENAIKYTPEGGAIWCNVRGDGDRVLINITDTGIGISPEDTKHIFQKFYRVDNSQTREIGGTGLGLYLVKQRVEAMGGKVWVESSFGEGSTFYVSLPRLTYAEYERRRQIIANSEAMSAGTIPKTAGHFTASGFVADQPAAQSVAPVQPPAQSQTPTPPITQSQTPTPPTAQSQTPTPPTAV